MPDIFLYQGEANPNDIVLSDPTVQRGGGSPVNYTLVCASGSYVYTGQAATLTLARKLSLAAGAYVYTGQAATLTVARRLALDAGAYVYAGNNATLAYVAGRVAYTLTCAVGAYVYAGQAASLTVARKLALDAGAYAYAGNDAVLDYVPGGVDYTLACNAGAYTIAGNDASLTYNAGVTRALGGHFGFDDKKRNKRWKKYLDAERERRETLIAAFNGLPDRAKPEAVEAIAGSESISINWQPIAVDVESFHAAIMKMAIIKAMRQDEDDVLDLIEMGVL